MDVKQLRYFVAIAEERQITRAAKRLHMAQPPLGKQLKLLEEELGTTLLERNRRGLELTVSGKLLYKRAINLLSQFDETIKEIKENEEGLRGVFSIGTLTSCIPYLSKRLRYFREHYPLVTFKLWEGSPSYLSQLLEDRDIEIAFVRPPLANDRVSMIQLDREEFVLALPSHWAEDFSQTAIPINEIGDMPLVLLRNGKDIGYFELIENECRRLGFEMNVIGECTNATIILSLVADGIGATILPRSIVASILKI